MDCVKQVIWKFNSKWNTDAHAWQNFVRESNGDRWISLTKGQ